MAKKHYRRKHPPPSLCGLRLLGLAAVCVLLYVLFHLGYLANVVPSVSHSLNGGASLLPQRPRRMLSTHVDAPPKPPPPEKWKGQWNVAVAVMFNWPAKQDALDFLYRLYEPHFIKVVFAGPPLDQEGKRTGIQALQDGYDYLNCQGDCNGAVGYVCLAQVIRSLEHHPPASGHYAGYLWVHDDVTFHLSVFDRLPLTAVWKLDSQTMLSGGDREHPVNWTRAVALGTNALKSLDEFDGWVWWNTMPAGCPGEGKPIGAPALVSAWHSLDRRCKAHVQRLRGVVKALEGGGDVFYIPESMARDFTSLAEHFHSHNVWLEIATPIILDCLASIGAPGEGRTPNAASLHGSWLWDEQRRQVHDYAIAHNKSIDFLHPVKCSQPEVWKLASNFFFGLATPLKDD